jgi:hypothetical protein
MPLTGEARTKYQREYMRRRRATARQGKGAPSPAPMSGREAELQAALVSERNGRRDLEAQLASERTRRLAAEAKAKAGPKTARPPVDPESELGRAKAKIVELQARLRATVQERDRLDELLRRAGLSKAVLNILRRALHRDQAAYSTPESREAALATLNADLDRHEKRARR